MAESTKNRALRMLEKRDYSRLELIERLVKKGETREDAQAAADRLCELRFIDDANYAAMVVRHYAAKGFGEARIRDELRHRFVPRELWDDALAEMPEPDGAVDALLRTKLKSSDPDAEALRKAADALRRRGFSWEAVKGAVERFNTERKSRI